jgi:hypothetical protein
MLFLSLKFIISAGGGTPTGNFGLLGGGDQKWARALVACFFPPHSIGNVNRRGISRVLFIRFSSQAWLITLLLRLVSWA